MLTLLTLLACSNTVPLTGEVKDIWGQPVPDATIVLDGVVERYTADSAGRFTIELEPGARLSRAMAGHEGYIKRVLDVPAPQEESGYAPLSFELYPQPERTGFFGVGDRVYNEIHPQKLQVVGTELKHYTGVADIPSDALPPSTTRFLFETNLRTSEIARMNLHLSKLEFVDKTDVKSILGPTDATINLFVSREEIPFDLEALGNRTSYLLTTRAPLPAGIYAFHAQDVLNETDARVVHELPKEMRVVFPFEVQ